VSAIKASWEQLPPSAALKWGVWGEMLLLSCGPTHHFLWGVVDDGRRDTHGLGSVRMSCSRCFRCPQNLREDNDLAVRYN
jgi:hypothetical protein